PELVDHPRYRVVGVLGAGGMGVVYRAEHRLMERPVALKVIHRDLLRDPDAVERFRREVRAAARLAHPNIVTAHDAEQAGDLHFLVMEYVDGVSLARLVEKKGPLPVVYACHYVRQAALGLQHAHERGLVHRDIKPPNLMITGDGSMVKILDMGLARLTASDLQSHSQMTQQGVFMGTPDFVAPEQAVDARQADIRSDIYSLGCTFYFLLTGQLPFPSETVVEKIDKHRWSMPTPVEQVRADIPEVVSHILQKMMAKQ